ncbi:signal transduction histidine kinase [Sporosarcina luteola]|nr:signal transduction histidine kinase [Sporosarcina luteola]
MKLETKISIALLIILLTLGAVFFITGFSVLNFLSVPLEIDGFVVYVVVSLLFIGIIILMGFVIDRQVRKPLFFFISWIDQLSFGVFKMPDMIKNFSFNQMRLRPFLELKVKLDGLTYQLNAAEKERKELEETRKNWTSGVTHDLKTPLSYIKGYAAMLRSEHKWDGEEIKEFAKIIEEKSLYMEQLIDDLSIVYEFDKMQIPLHLRTVDLVAFVENVLEDLRQSPMAEDYAIHLNVKNEGGILLSFDQTLLKRALENFIMNAIYHNPPKTIIIVSIETTEDATLIEIKDDGIGMDEKTIRHLFNQYYRGTTTDKAQLGSGLGMSIAKQFIERQKGQIAVESELDKGTKIKILFPSKN